MPLQDHLAGLRDIGRGAARGAAALPADLATLVNMLLPLPGRGERIAAGERMSEKAKALITSLLGEKEGTGVAQTGGEFVGPPVKGALKMAALLGAVPRNLLEGWKLRDPALVKKELGLTAVPEHVQKEFGPFMQQQAARAQAGDLGVDDLLKAYAITRGSVQRGARDIPFRGSVRPEDAAAEWLMTNAGRDYRGAGALGTADARAIEDAKQMMQPFGLAETFGKDLTYGAEQLPGKFPGLQSALTGSIDDFYKYATGIRNIGAQKVGFLGTNMGRGDISTADARIKDLILPDMSKQEFGNTLRRGGGEGGRQAIEEINRWKEQMALELDPSLKPFYQALGHHGIWDAAEGTTTSHMPIIEAMLDVQKRGSPPRFSAAHGAGATPNNRNVDYMGFQTMMPASKFLELAPPTHYDPESLAFLQKALTEGRPLGQPFLEPRWNEARKTWDVAGHEGRHRSHSIAQMFGPESEIPVHIFPGGGMRSRHVTDEMRQAPFVDQTTVRREADEAYRREKLAKLLRGEDE